MADAPDRHFPTCRPEAQSLQSTTVQVLKKEFIAVIPAAYKEVMMGERFSSSMVTVAIAAAALGTAISLRANQTAAQTPAFSNQALTTPWGEPDLQGIWTD